MGTRDYNNEWLDCRESGIGESLECNLREIKVVLATECDGKGARFGLQKFSFSSEAG